MAFEPAVFVALRRAFLVAFEAPRRFFVDRLLIGVARDSRLPLAAAGCSTTIRFVYDCYVEYKKKSN